MPLNSTQPPISGKKNSTQLGKHEVSELKEVANLLKIDRARSRFDTETAGSNSQAYTDQSDSILQDMRALNTHVVGFTATLLNNAIDLPTGSTVVFEYVFYNAGNGYDTTTGIFTCPRSGLYIFYINVEAVNGNEEAAVQLMKNGSGRVSAVSERYVDGHDSTGGNLLVEHIMEGDRVWVETYSVDNQDLFRLFTTFSGVLR